MAETQNDTQAPNNPDADLLQRFRKMINLEDQLTNGDRENDDPIYSQLDAVKREIVAMPATGVVGLAVKLQALAFLTHRAFGLDAEMLEVADSALAAVARLAPEALVYAPA